MSLKLAKARKARGLTQQQLAQKVGVSRPLISQVECRERRAYPLLKERIAEALSVGPEEIFW